MNIEEYKIVLYLYLLIFISHYVIYVRLESSNNPNIMIYVK